MAEMTYQQRSHQSTRMAVNQQRSSGRVLQDNRAAFKQTTQLKIEDEDEAKALQKKSASAAPVQREEQVAKPNNTGLPDNLKSGIENLSGMSMDNVRVHYNSNKPAQLNALAYAQGTDIHVASGQEKHLPHEAWHVVQQAQGRVKPTMQMKGGVPVNDDKGLEREADVMGAKASMEWPKKQGIGSGGDKPISAASIQLLKDSEITSTKSGNGASKVTVLDLKRKRPPYAEGQVDAVWDAAPKDTDGKAICPNSGKKITWTKGESRQGIWDMGHKTGHEYRTLWESLATCGINYDTFISEYQNPNNYQVEDASTNRSHQFEA